MGGSMRSRSIVAPVNLSTIERSPPPRDWTPWVVKIAAVGGGRPDRDWPF